MRRARSSGGRRCDPTLRPGSGRTRTPPRVPTRVPTRSSVAVLLFTVAVASGACATNRTDRESGRSGSRSTTSSTAEPRRNTEVPENTAPPSTPPPGPTDTTVPRPPATAPRQDAAAGTVLVVGIVDGDTIDVDTGERIRLIGVDTPERGRCGAAEATAATRSLVANKEVVLTPGARDDRDRYGRALRYVDVDGVDLGMELLRRGLAVARYDSRDGYPRHDREAAYIAASAPAISGCSGQVAPASNAATPAGPTTVAGASGAAGAPQRFSTCKQAIAAGFGPYRRGVDPEYDWYRDADGDGIVCER